MHFRQLYNLLSAGKGQREFDPFRTGVLGGPFKRGMELKKKKKKKKKKQKNRLPVPRPTGDWLVRRCLLIHKRDNVVSEHG